MTNTRHKGLALAVLALSQLMIVLDGSIVNVALTHIQRALNFQLNDLQWIVNGYTLAFGGFLMLGGRFADRLGRKKIFMAGLLLFVAASALGGSASSSTMLIVARAIQGLGGALMAPAALSLLSVIFDEGEERNKALGVWGGIAAGGAAIGLLMGGILTQYLNWRWCFFVNIPIGALAIVGTLKFVPESKDESAPGFDLVGAFTVTGGLVALVYALVRGNVVGWATTQTIGTLAIAVALLLGFVLSQQTSKHPLVPLRIFKNRNVVGADSACLMLGAGMFGMFFYVSLFIQNVMGYSVIKTGLAFLPVSLVIMASAGTASAFLTKVGPRRMAAVGLSIAAVGLALLTQISTDSSYVVNILIPLVILAAGMGPSFVSLTSAAISGVPKDDSGLASALLNTAQQIGGALGLAVLTAVSTGRTKHLVENGAGSPASALTSGFAWAFGVSAALLASGALISALVLRVTAEDVIQLEESEGVPVGAH